MIRIAARNVWINWRHSLAAIVSVAAGFVSFSLFQGYMDDVGRMYRETFSQRMMFGDILLEHAEAQTPEGRADDNRSMLGEPEQKFIADFEAKHASELGESVRFLKATGSITNGKTSTIFLGYGYDVQEGARMRKNGWQWNTLVGVPMQLAPTPDSLVVGQSLGAILGCVPVKHEIVLTGGAGYTPIDRPFTCLRDRLQLNVMTGSGQLNSLDLKLVGMVDAAYKDLDTKFLAMPLPLAQTLMNTRAVTRYAIEVKDRDRILPLIAEINDESKRQGLKVWAGRWETHKVGDLYRRTLDLLSIFRNFVVSVILVIAALSVMITFIKMVKERSREIGTLRSIGFLTSQIIGIFTWEAFFLGTIGNLTGLLITLVTTGVVNHLGIVYKAGMLAEPVPFRIAWSFGVYAIGFVILMVIPVLAAWGSSYRTANRKPAHLLAHV